MSRAARARMLRMLKLTVLLAFAGPWGAGAAPVSAQVNDNVIGGGIPDQSSFNGLWWGSYDAFSPQARVGAGVPWSNFYIPPPPGETAWNGPYYTAPHWEPYVPRPIGWSGLEYSVANAPPDSTKPHGWYGPYSPGWRSDPAYAFEFWKYIEPELRAREQARAGGIESGATTAFEAGAMAAMEAERAGVRERPRFRQYIRNPAPEPGQSPWRAYDSRAPEAPPEPTSPLAVPRGFTQYYRQTAPGPDQGRWVTKSAPPAPRR